jgi:hypothetical protein
LFFNTNINIFYRIVLSPFLSNAIPLKSKCKMNARAIQANKGDLVQADSHLPGPPNFIVDFTFSPPLDGFFFSSSSSHSLPPRHLLRSRPNHSRYATNPNTITANPLHAERESAAECPRFRQQPFAGFPLSRRIAREYRGAIFSRRKL